MHIPVRSLTLAAGLLAVGALVVTTGGVSANARPASSAKPVYGGTLTLDTQDAPQELDPAKVSDVVSGQFAYLMYNTLVTYSATGTKIGPGLAEKWRETDSGRTWTFWLKPGVTFWNGDPVTAQDVVWTMTRLNEGAVDAPYQFSYANLVGAEKVFNATKAAKDITSKTKVAGISAVGKDEVVMHLVDAQLYWLNVLALPSASIEDPSVAGQYTADETSAHAKPITPMGTGPFVLKPVSPSADQYVFTANPHYFVKGLPYLAKIVINIGATPELQLQQFQKGQVGALPPFLTNFGLAPAQYLQVTKSPTLKKEYFILPNNGVNYLSFNVQVAPFNSLDVREAVEYATNKELLFRTLYNGRGSIADSILPPNMPGYQTSAEFNPFKVTYTTAGMKQADKTAKALLKKAGYTKFPVNLGTFYIIAGPGDTQLAGEVPTMLAAAGMKVSPKIIQFGPFLTLGETTNKLDFYALGWTQDYPDPQDFLFNLFDSAEAGGNNFSYYKDPTIDRELQVADSSVHAAARITLYDKIQDAIMDQAVIVPMSFGYQDGMIAPNVYPKDPVYWAHPVQPAELDRVWVAPGG